MQENYYEKTLIRFSGIYGLVIGILQILSPLFIVSMIAYVVSSSSNSTSGQAAGSATAWIIAVPSVIALVLGIMNIVYYNRKYKDQNSVSIAPSILMIIGGAFSALIPLFALVGGILITIGGALYLSNVKRVNM